jgi:hypothetical protein
MKTSLKAPKGGQYDPQEKENPNMRRGGGYISFGHLVISFSSREQRVGTFK